MFPEQTAIVSVNSHSNYSSWISQIKSLKNDKKLRHGNDNYNNDCYN